MHNKHMRKQSKQQGFVSILTVMFFIILLSVITVSFTRLMIEERRQTLEDQLSKSAYNSAMAGVEDAKRALLWCSQNPGGAGCSQLYNKVCPGFNNNEVFAGIGINKSLVANDDQLQGYSCVTLDRNSPEIKGELKTSGSGELYEIRTVSPYNQVVLEWHLEDLDATQLRSSLYYAHGNRRAGSDLGEGYGTGPASLRLMFMNTPNASSFDLSEIVQQSFFVYPTSTTTVANLSAPDVAVYAGDRDRRAQTSCSNSPPRDYKCKVTITYTGGLRSSGRYILLNALYRDTDFRITAYNNAAPNTPIPLDGVQTRIDSTGYASGVYRRVSVDVQVGGQALNTANAIDTGLGFCKNFRVGVDPSLFHVDEPENCLP